MPRRGYTSLHERTLLDVLPTFVALARTGSIQETARRLGVPRSTVSRRLARLEEALGVKLAERTNRSFRLTPAGALLAREGSEVLARGRTLAERVRELGGALSGSLRVSAPPGLAGPFLARFLERFTTDFPALRVAFLVRDRVPHLIDEGFDLAFAMGPLPDLPWVRHRLAPSWYLLVARPERVVCELEDLGSVPLLYGRLPGQNAPALPLCDGGSIPVEPTLLTNDPQLVRHAVLAGRGIALLPYHLVAEDLAAGRLVPVLTDCVGARVDVVALFTPERRSSPLLRALLSTMDRFVAELVEGFALPAR